MRFEPVNAQISERGDIYYVTSFDGQCTIWEINTQLTDNVPQKIFEQRTNRCLGFYVYKKNFYLIDEKKVVNKLEQNMDTRMLDNIYDLYLKEIDKPNFVYNMFTPIIIRDNYIVYHSSIFYLYRDTPLNDGILDMEELLESQDESHLDKKLLIDAF